MSLPLYISFILCLSIASKGSVITKRQATSCPPNCFRCDEVSCSSCNSGWYGEDCSRSCSGCPGGCMKDTGVCLCPAGTFGPTCSQTCPANCGDKNGIVKCGIADGQCESGCKTGYFGDICNLTCVKCTTCDQKTGYCISGCSSGWGGLKCNISCIPNCLKCSQQYSCEECSKGHHGPQCAENIPISSSINIITSVHPEVHFSPDQGLSKTTIEVIIGVSFGVMLLLLLVLVLAYTNRHKCKAKEYEENEPMYIQDTVGSPRLSRSYLNLHMEESTVSGNKQDVVT